MSLTEKIDSILFNSEDEDDMIVQNLKITSLAVEGNKVASKVEINITFTEQMNFLIGDKITNRKRMLVRQIVFSYQMHVSEEFRVCKEGTKISHLSSMTHKVIASKKVVKTEDSKKFDDEIVEKFVIESKGKLATAADIDDCLAEIRSLGTGSSHPHLMFDANLKPALPTEGDMLKFIDELEDMNDDMKEGARGALKVVLMLSKGKRQDFLNSTCLFSRKTFREVLYMSFSHPNYFILSTHDN
jgi:hypothetical protein